MIYILVVMWFGTNQAAAGKAALAVEFNDKASCEAAAAEIQRQEKLDSWGKHVGTILCAAKGKP